MNREIGSLGEILTQQAVGVLIGAAQPLAGVMSRDIADGFGQYIADTSHDGARVVGQCLGIGDWCRW